MYLPQKPCDCNGEQTEKDVMGDNMSAGKNWKEQWNRSGSALVTSGTGKYRNGFDIWLHAASTSRWCKSHFQSEKSLIIELRSSEVTCAFHREPSLSISVQWYERFLEWPKNPNLPRQAFSRLAVSLLRPSRPGQTHRKVIGAPIAGQAYNPARVKMYFCK